MDYTVLGIETSCDETAAAVYTTQQGLLSNELYTQMDMHAVYGGVVPEVSSRLHMQKMKIIVQQALDAAHKKMDDIDVIAVTHKPGLPGSLMIGVSFAKGLALGAQKKLIGVNHLEGHVFSACVDQDISFPFLCMTASGGHTSLYYVTDYGEYECVGSTRDDAAGEAFDKISKMIGLGYPGGPVIEKLARSVNFIDYFSYPRGKNTDLSFSFSGLKTAVMYDLIKKGAYNLSTKTFLQPDNEELKVQVASSLQVCIADIFEQKIARAFLQYPDAKALAFVGGVACNRYIRDRLSKLAAAQNKQCFAPSPRLCTDNAGMIAFVGHYKAQQGHFSDQTLSILR